MTRIAVLNWCADCFHYYRDNTQDAELSTFEQPAAKQSLSVSRSFDKKIGYTGGVWGHGNMKAIRGFFFGPLQRTIS